MQRGAVRLALWVPLVIAAAIAAAYFYFHRPFASDSDELLVVSLSVVDPELDRVGDLRFLGGLDIPPSRLEIGGLSALRWNNGTMLSLTDDGRVVTFIPTERGGQLIALTKLRAGPLHDTDGEPLTGGKAQSDSESLTLSDEGGYLVGFERDHRIWRYGPVDFAALPTDFDPVTLLGELQDNRGVEVLAGNERNLVACAERAATPERDNCVRIIEGNAPAPFSVAPPREIANLGGVPTDADASSDGTLYVLFRSYSPADGNGAAIVAYAPDGTRRELATLRPPLTVDNFEGLAVREEGEGAERRTFLYIVSDDNFSGSQRTLLMKFEVLSGAAD